MKKRLIVIAGSILLACLIAFTVMAVRHGIRAGKHTAMMGVERGNGRWGIRGENYGNLTTPQREQIEKLQKNFRDDNAEILKQLMTKRFDLQTILESDKPDVDKAKEVQKDISELNGKLAQKRIDLYIEMHKVNPDVKSGLGFEKGLSIGMMNNGNDLDIL